MSTLQVTTLYLLGVERALGATLGFDLRTKDLNLILKSGVTTDFDLLLDGYNLRINNKY